MKIKITPKLFAFTAFMLTAFYFNAQDIETKSTVYEGGNLPVTEDFLNKPVVDMSAAQGNQMHHSHVSQNATSRIENPNVLAGGVKNIAGYSSSLVQSSGTTVPVNASEDKADNSQALALTCPQNMLVYSASPSGRTVNYSLPVISGSCAQCVLPTTLPQYTYIGEFNGHRYFKSNFNRRWTDAKSEAASLSGNGAVAHLVTVTSEAENNFLSSAGEAWIGLTDEITEGTYAWVTGEAYAYANWWPGEPNNGGAGGNEDYVYMNFYGSTKWVDFDGVNYFKPFIVEFECPPSPIPTQTGGIPSGGNFPVGVTTNSFTYTDPCNNTATCSFTITVELNQETTIACPQNIQVNASSGAGAIVNYSLPVVTDNCQQCTGPATLPGFTLIGEFNGHRYFRSNFTRNWATAKDTAGKLGAHLVTITDEAENNFVSGDGNQAWIGLTDEASEGNFVWVTGEPFVYSNWWPGNPNNTGGIEDHVFMNFYGSTKWVDHSGTDLNLFIIEFECSTSPVPAQTAGLPSGSVFPIGVTTNSFTYTDACQFTATCSFTVTVINNLPTTMTCPANIQVNATSAAGATVNYSQPVIAGSCQQCTLPNSLPGFTYLGEFGGHTYFRSNFTRHWRTAKDTANRLGGHLVTITSEAENNFVTGDGNPAWIGLTDEVTEGEFKWVTNEPFVYSNWWPGNPNNTGGIEDHVYMNFYGSTKWVDHNEFEIIPFIIEFECTFISTQTAGLPSGSVFPVGVTTNSFTYTDGCQNTVTCSFTITVVNNQVTTLTCPQNIQVNATGQGGTVVNYNAPVVATSCQQCTSLTSIPGYTYLGVYNDNKYFLSSATKRWTDAKAEAESLGAHLVTVTSTGENNFLSGAGQAWIGLTDEVTEGTFKWVTGEPYAYTNWWPGEPNNGGAGGNEDFVFMNFYGSTKWVDFGTNYFLKYIIEFECSSAPPIPVQTGGLPSGSVFPIGVTTNSFSYTDQCQNTVTCSFTVNVVNTQGTTMTCPQNVEVSATSGSGATVNYNLPVISSSCQQCTGPTSIPNYTYLGDFNGHRYFRSNFANRWTEARDLAISNGAHLVTITSAAESNFISGNGAEAWIGLTDEASEGNFVWVTGELVGYTNWWPGNPNGGTAENHVSMNFYGTTKWIDTYGTNLHPFIMEFECSGSPFPTQTAGLPNGSVFPVGVTTNSFTYTDACQTTVTCSFTVTVLNSLPTALTCPQNVVTTATSGAGAVVNYNPPVVSGSCQQCSTPTSIPGYIYIGEFNGHRYFRSDFIRSWTAAKNDAISLGAHLVTITSEAENNFASSGANLSWIGLTDEASEGNFVWVTGEPLGYTNWWPVNPNGGTLENHVAMNFYGSTKWVDSEGAGLYPFIIEFECTPPPTQTAGLPSGSVFPIGVTTNSFTYTDACQATVTCSFTVTVNANTKPALPVFTKIEELQVKKEMVVNSKEESLKEIMQVRAYPNPSAGDFNLVVVSDNDEPISLRILDATGTVKKALRFNNKIKTVSVGNELRAGVYIAEITQGTAKQMLKLVKLN